MMEQQTLFAGMAVGHTGTRRAADYYPTPAWCTAALLPYLLRAVPPGPNHLIVEPGIGHGAIARPLVAAGYQVHGVDTRPDAVAECQAQGITAELADFETWTPRGMPIAGIVGNPPYSRALEFIERALFMLQETGLPPGLRHPFLAFLLSLDFLATTERAEFWRRHPADVLVLDRRPSFTGDGNAFTNYGWFVWPPRLVPAYYDVDAHLTPPQRIGRIFRQVAP